MISDNVILKDGEIRKEFRIFKAVYGIALPVLVLFTAIFAFFALFESAAGRHSKAVAIALLCVGLALCAGLIVANKIFSTNSKYDLFEVKIVRKLNLGTVIPLVLLVLFTLIPFYILFITSLKTPAEANAIGFSWWPKDGFGTAYKELMEMSETLDFDYIRAFTNSLFYTLVPCVAGLFVSALSAYGFSKLYFPGRKFMFDFLLLTIMLPGCVTMSSSYVLFDTLLWFDSELHAVCLPLLLPGCFGGITTVMFLKEYYAGIPNDLLAAAQIDGAGKMKIFFSFMIPLGKPALMAQFVLGFISGFNSYLTPLLYTASEPMWRTLPVLLQMLQGKVSDRALTSASSIVALVPVFILYLAFQKQILNGISMSSGLKG